MAKTFVAHCRDYPPELSYEGKTCVGVIPELVTDVFSELGHDIEWVKTPWIRSVKAAKGGVVDLMIRHSMTKERSVFLKPIVYGHGERHLSFYKSPRFKGEIKSYDDLSKHNIGAIRGNFYSPSFSTLDTNVLTLVGNTEQLIGMLEKGRIDIAVTSASHSEDLFKIRFEKAAFVDSFYNPMYISIPLASDAIEFYDDIAEKMLEYRRNNKVNSYFERYNVPAPKQLFDVQ